MALQSLLIFDLDGARFGVDAAWVRESVWLPELSPVEEAPTWIVGVFSLRGRIVPVADLRLRFGHPARPATPDDRVVVIDTEPEPIGVIASDVVEVVDLPPEALGPSPQFGAAAQLIAAEARVGEGLVAVLDLRQLGRLARGSGESSPRPAPAIVPQAEPEKSGLFHARALALREPAAAQDGGRLGLAVIELGGERFGVELAAVREFCNVAQLFPIPCCPLHILGAINLRGELITLVDPRAALDLPGGGAAGKAVIGSVGAQAVAIAVDEVHDVVYLRPEELQPPPPALAERHGAEVRGTAAYGDGMMTVLDLGALLARKEWIVEETV